jgi:hypothetical protein
MPRLRTRSREWFEAKVRELAAIATALPAHRQLSLFEQLARRRVSAYGKQNRQRQRTLAPASTRGALQETLN